MSILPNAINVPMAALGYNGEAHELRSRWQLLGAGYRAYNPVLMRFHSADTLSPFGRGGFNAYAYCSNDPVNRVDPSGHFNWYALAALVIGGGTAAGSYFMPNEMAAQTMLYTGAAVGILGGAGLAYSGLKFLYGGKRSLGPGGVPRVPGHPHPQPQPLIPHAKVSAPLPGGPRPQPSTRSTSFSSASSVSGGSSLSSRSGSTNSTRSLTPSEQAALDTFEYGFNQGLKMGHDSALLPTTPIASTSVPAPAPVSTPLPVQTQVANGAGGQSFTFNFFMGEGSRGLSTSNANTNIRA